jgi:hypothetical protein
MCLLIQDNNNLKKQIIGFRVTEEELQNTIYPVCMTLLLSAGYIIDIMIYPDIVPTVFGIKFWIAHYYHMKKQQFEVSQQEIDEEMKLAEIIAQKEQAYEKSTMGVIERATKGVEELGERLERDFEEDTVHPPLSHQPRRTSQQPTTASRTANLSLEDMMA